MAGGAWVLSVFLFFFGLFYSSSVFSSFSTLFFVSSLICLSSFSFIHPYFSFLSQHYLFFPSLICLSSFSFIHPYFSFLSQPYLLFPHLSLCLPALNSSLASVFSSSVSLINIFLFFFDPFFYHFCFPSQPLIPSSSFFFSSFFCLRLVFLASCPSSRPPLPPFLPQPLIPPFLFFFLSSRLISRSFLLLRPTSFSSSLPPHLHFPLLYPSSLFISTSHHLHFYLLRSFSLLLHLFFFFIYKNFTSGVSTNPFLILIFTLFFSLLT